MPSAPILSEEEAGSLAGPAGGSLLGHDAFVTDLIEMLTAALAAPHRAAPDGLAQAGA
ncbi:MULTISPECIES: hypothetical protein [Thermomonosporaceae]|uniref:hypothetical protein n=1 Tax=Thermomonosporaceae TaxID=2012 RepID=UPI00255B1D9B|nr:MULTISPECIES: hypothetical protein [Thermomonosporaceae]MDL4772017.1 hypothetical protein [Actinomadura xylanilytica]